MWCHIEKVWWSVHRLVIGILLIRILILIDVGLVVLLAILLLLSVCHPLSHWRRLSLILIWRNTTIEWPACHIHAIPMWIIYVSIIFIVQLSVRTDIHGSLFSLWPWVKSCHSCILSSLTGILSEENWVKEKCATVQVTSLLVLITTHLDVVVLSNDYIIEHLLNNSLLHLRILLGFLLSIWELVDISIVVFVAVFIFLSLSCLLICYIFTFCYHLGCLRNLLPIALSSVLWNFVFQSCTTTEG